MRKSFMRVSCRVVILILCSYGIPLYAVAGSPGMEMVMPAPDCAEGWRMDGKTVFFDKVTLFDRINGESELYFPYGFEMLAYARYENERSPAIAVDADVYKMGSLLDAFGMFANYRKMNDSDIPLGAGGTVSDSQVFFYQDRYFVRLQATGAVSIPRQVLTACAEAIAKKLPRTTAEPRELEALKIPEVVSKSERYIARSLLGYEFFGRGLMADLRLKNGEAQIFVVLDQSTNAARKSIEQYRSFLASSAAPVTVHEEKDRVSLQTKDPLYGTVVAEQSGRFVIGVIRTPDVEAAKKLAAAISKRLRAE